VREAFREIQNPVVEKLDLRDASFQGLAQQTAGFGNLGSRAIETAGAVPRSELHARAQKLHRLGQ
jgi:hypothetical protein